jgi:hypothetical protein
VSVGVAPPTGVQMSVMAAQQQQQQQAAMFGMPRQVEHQYGHGAAAAASQFNNPFGDAYSASALPPSHQGTPFHGSGSLI